MPDTAEIGDQVYLLLGGQVLYVLRPFEGHHRLVGECYIHGLVDGEALESLKHGLVELSWVGIR